MSEKIQCGGLIERRDLVLLEIMGYEWRPGSSCGILGKFAAEGVPLCYLSIGRCADGKKHLAVCVERKMLDRCRPILDGIQAEFEPQTIDIVENVIILTVYGPHFYEKVALASEVYGSLCMVSINAHSVGSSVNSISMIVDATDRERTIASLRTRFVWPE